MQDKFKAIFRQHWDEIVLETEMKYLAAEVRHCRCKETKRKEGQGDMARVVLAIDVKHQQLEEVLRQIIVLQGGVRKVGPAPRGPLEREAQQLLNTLKD